MTSEYRAGRRTILQHGQVGHRGNALPKFLVFAWMLACGISCGFDGQASTSAGPVQVASKDMIEFSAQFVIENGELVLTYSVHNRHDRDVYLLNRLYRSTPVWDMSANVIYIHLDAKNRVVWLNKKIPDIPKHVLVNSPVAPFVTPVRAGARFTEQVRIALPLRDFRQYGVQAGGPSTEATESAPEEVVYRQVYFTLGYYWGLPGTTEEVRNIQGTDVVFPTAPQEAGFPEFGEFQSEMVQLDIPVLEFREP